MGILLTILGGIGSLFVGGLGGFLAGRLNKAADRKAEAEKERRLRGNFLYHVTLDSLNQLTMFAQYHGQGLNGKLSFSKPSTTVTPDQVTELIRLGAPPAVIRAIHDVQKLYAHVKGQVDRAQEEQSASSLVIPPVGMGPRDPSGATFARASAFIRDDWEHVREGVDVLLKATQAEGIDVCELRFPFDAAVRKYQTALAEAPGIPKPLTDAMAAGKPVLTGSPIPSRPTNGL
jgi:hypothetical protein